MPSAQTILADMIELADQIDAAITGGSYMNRLNAWPREKAMKAISDELRHRVGDYKSIKALTNS